MVMVLSFMQLFLHCVLFGGNFICQVKEPLYVACLKRERMVEFVKTYGHYHDKFKFGHFFHFLSKILKDLHLKFRSKFNYVLTNHGYLHSAILHVLIQL